MIGIDIVEIDDFKGRDYSKIFTQGELEYISKATSLERKDEIMAGLYAGKEAVFKALKLNSLGLEVLKSIEILHDENGVPYCKYGGVMLEISISHTHSTAVAVAVVKN